MLQTVAVSASLMLCLVVAASAAGQSGAVVDARTRTPIAGAEVTLVGQRGSERTDETGRFRWTTAPHPPIEVIVVLPDGSVARPIRLAQLDPTGEITLAVDPALTEQAVEVEEATLVGHDLHPTLAHLAVQGA